MKIGLIGHGVIGRAVAANAKVDVLVCDRAQPDTLTLPDLIAQQPSLYIVAVGTPVSTEGHCDTADLYSVLRALWDVEVPVIIHSTAPTSFYADHKRPQFVHIPEFVTEKNAVSEYAQARYMIVGSSDQGFANEATRRWEVAFKPHSRQRQKFYHTTPETAAMVKYLTNTMLALKVAYLNQCADLARALGVPWSDVVDLCRLDDRLGSSHWMVPGPDGKYGYGGMCFPKDVAAFIAEATALDIDFDLLEVTQQVNLELRERSCE